MPAVCLLLTMRAARCLAFACTCLAGMRQWLRPPRPVILCQLQHTSAHCLQLHGKFCSRCTYNGAKIGAKESKCTGVNAPLQYALVGGVVGELHFCGG